MSQAVRLAVAFAAFIGAIFGAAITLAVVLAVVRLWLEGDGKPSWLFREQATLVGPSSPADLLLVLGSIALALGIAIFIWRFLGKK